MNVGEVPHIFLFSTQAGERLGNKVSVNLEAVVRHELDALGYDLVLIRRSGTRSRAVVEIRIDRRDGERINVGDCVRASRAIEARIDADTATTPLFPGGRYELQVSSPGDARREAAGAPPGTEKISEAPQRSAVDEYTRDGSRDGWVS